MRPSIRTATLSSASAALVAGLLVGPAAPPALADHTAIPSRVTLMGSLMTELGCPADWDETCTATDLPRVGSTATFSRVFTVPEGAYELKVRLDGSWDENYGDSSGTFGLGGNIPLPLEHDAELPRDLRPRDAPGHGGAGGCARPARPRRPGAGGDEPAQGPHARTLLLRHGGPFRERQHGERPGRSHRRAARTRASTRRARGSTTAATSRVCARRLDYIQGLGTTAIWMTPSFKNRPVQGSPGKESAGYHGYWITDFTQVDPHLGTNADLKALVDAAHKRGMKVFFDIITNHTADVLDYPESAYAGAAGNQSVPYVSKADEPYKDASGTPFDDRDYARRIDLPGGGPRRHRSRTRRCCTPGDENAKTPAWLNDPTMYHNRGTSTFAGEDSEYGDFPSGDRSALDDLWTERPEVVKGMEDIYKTWVREAGVDGFRIDTVKHVNIEFWQQFAPALTGYAARRGNSDFFMFGEVYDANPAFMSRYTTEGRLQATVDFGFQAGATAYAKGDGQQAHRRRSCQQFFAADDWYTDADSNAYSLPTFLGNHDMGRIGKFLTDSGASGRQLLQRDQLAHALMYTTRGQPVVYYGDEQGFTGDGGDQDARQDMFASKVASYNDDDLIGTSATHRDRQLRRQPPDLPVHHGAGEASREEPGAGRRSADPSLRLRRARGSTRSAGSARVATSSTSSRRTARTPRSARRFADVRAEAEVHQGLAGARARRRSRIALRSDRSAKVTVTVPARSVVVYRAVRPLRPDRRWPHGPRSAHRRRARCSKGARRSASSLPRADFSQATVSWRTVGGTRWIRLGTDDNAPYRVFHDVSGAAQGDDRGVPRGGEGPRRRPRRRVVVGRGREGAGGHPAGRTRSPSLRRWGCPAATGRRSGARTAAPTAARTRVTGTRRARRRSWRSTPVTASGRA